jgi:FkbM family methyltransferase
MKNSNSIAEKSLPESTVKYNINFYSRLLRIRPAQLGAFVKQIFHIQRFFIPTQLGLRFWADPVSVFGIELMETEIYEPQMTRLLQSLLRPRDVFVDIGGNEGYFSLLAASLVKDGKVHCFEPQSRLQPILSKNIQANNVEKSVLVHPVALSDSEGEVKIFLRPSTNNGASSLFRHWKLGSASETISTTTLDNFLKTEPIQHIRLVKVDCEGAEYLVVAGGKTHWVGK